MKCFWETGCSDSARCREFGQCVAAWQNANKDDIKRTPSAGERTTRDATPRWRVKEHGDDLITYWKTKPRGSNEYAAAEIIEELERELAEARAHLNGALEVNDINFGITATNACISSARSSDRLAIDAKILELANTADMVADLNHDREAQKPWRVQWYRLTYELRDLVKGTSAVNAVAADVACDRAYVNGAWFGWKAALHGDREKFERALEGRNREIAAALREPSAAPAAAVTTEAVSVADILAAADHIEQNGKAVAAFGGKDVDEGRCRELCAMYLREFVQTLRLEQRLVALSAAPSARLASDDEPGRIPDLEPARINAEYWVNAAKGEKDKVQALICLHRAVNAWKNAAYAMADGRDNARAGWHAERSAHSAKEVKT